MSDVNLAGGHLDELLSAELDGELTPEEATLVATHIEACEYCRREREALWRVKTSVQQLGPVEPPFGFEQQLLRAGRASLPRRLPTGRIAASLVATAAAWVAVLGFGVDLGTGQQVKPPVSDVRAFVGGGGPRIGGDQATKSTTSGPLPRSLDGRPLTNAFKTDNGWLATYGDDSDAITMFFQAGDVDWDSLTGGRRSAVSGLPGKPWQSIDDGKPALVFQDQDATVLLVGDVDRKELVAAAKDVPTYDAPSPSVGERLKDAGQSLIDSFGLK